MPGVDDFVVAGHVACCYCGEWMAEGSPSANRGSCNPCYKSVKQINEDTRLRYEAAGQVFPATTPAKKRKRSYRYPRTDGAKLHGRAKGRAVARLVQIYKPMYELLLAEEKAKVGINPNINPSRPTTAMTDKRILDEFIEAAEREERAAEARLLRAE